MKNQKPDLDIPRAVRRLNRPSNGQEDADSGATSEPRGPEYPETATPIPSGMAQRMALPILLRRGAKRPTARAPRRGQNQGVTIRQKALGAGISPLTNCQDDSWTKKQRRGRRGGKRWEGCATARCPAVWSGGRYPRARRDPMGEGRWGMSGRRSRRRPQALKRCRGSTVCREHRDQQTMPPRDMAPAFSPK